MRICKIELTRTHEQFIKVPLNSEIMDIQIQKGDHEDKFVMWILCDPESEMTEIKINMMYTGWDIKDGDLVGNDYLATIQSDGLVYHFFMEYEV